MWEIDGEDITLSRGDSFILNVKTRGRTIADGSTAKFTVMKKAGETAEIEKTESFESRVVSFGFDPEDTEDMEAGKYRYSLIVTDLDGNVYTAVENGVFKINEVIV